MPLVALSDSLNDMIDFKAASAFIAASARPIDRSVFNVLFGEGDPALVGDNLETFRNADGGFGHGLEPDKLIPDSQALDVEIEFQRLPLVGLNGHSVRRTLGPRWRPNTASVVLAVLWCCRWAAALVSSPVGGGGGNRVAPKLAAGNGHQVHLVGPVSNAQRSHRCVPAG